MNNNFIVETKDKNQIIISKYSIVLYSTKPLIKIPDNRIQYYNNINNIKLLISDDEDGVVFINNNKEKVSNNKILYCQVNEDIISVIDNKGNIFTFNNGKKKSIKNYINEELTYACSSNTIICLICNYRVTLINSKDVNISYLKFDIPNITCAYFDQEMLYLCNVDGYIRFCQIDYNNNLKKIICDNEMSF